MMPTEDNIELVDTISPSSKKSSYNFQFRYILVGDCGVGKTNFVRCLGNKKFLEEYRPTIGVDFGDHMIEIGENRVKLQIWDTSGQDSCWNITRHYYKGAAAAFLVYDITNRASFDNLQRWLEEIQLHSSLNIIIMLVGNKSDLGNKRQVTWEEGNTFAGNHGLLYIETSAKESVNVEKAVIDTGDVVLQRLQVGLIDTNNDKNGVKFGPSIKTEQRQVCCCCYGCSSH